MPSSASRASTRRSGGRRPRGAAATRPAARRRPLATARTCSAVPGSPPRSSNRRPAAAACFARLPATVSDPAPPLILLSHLDVVPVEASAWTHDPFARRPGRRRVWGRGAVDMKHMVAMELRRDARPGASRAPTGAAMSSSPSVADEEAGGAFGARHWVREPGPTSSRDATAGRAEAALNEVGGYSMTIGGRRVYTIQVAEKGIIWTRIRRQRHRRATAPCRTATTRRSSLPQAVTRLAAAPRPARLIAGRRGFPGGPGSWRRGAGRGGGDEDAVRNAARCAASPTRSCAARSTPCCATPSPRT